MHKSVAEHRLIWNIYWLTSWFMWLMMLHFLLMSHQVK